MEWEKASGQLTLLLDELLISFESERKKIFGCPAYFIHGNMFTGVFAENIFLEYIRGLPPKKTRNKP